MKSIFKIFLFLFLFFNSAFSYAQRSTYNFNSDWKVKTGDTTGAEKPGFNDAAWKPVTLPYAWNEDYAFKVSIDELPTGIAWYRKHFKLNPFQKGKKIILEFEGIRHGGEFFLNGKSIGLSENGVMAFGFDISDQVNFDGDNLIAARIDNAWNYHEKATNSGFEWNDKNFYANYGGINKNVYLHVVDPVYQTFPLYSNLGTTGVYVYGTDYDIPNRSATIHVEDEIKNASDKTVTVQLKTEIFDMDGKPVNSFTSEPAQIKAGDKTIVHASGKTGNLNFWSWGYGYLYNVKTSLIVDGKTTDELNTKIGFRKTEFKNGTLYLNDRAIQVHGYAQRTTNEWPAVGNAVPAWLSDYSNKLIVDGNGNLVRWMHVTPWKQDVESCDRVGLMEAMPAGDAEKDVEGRRWEQRKEVMRDAIIYNRSNPSIIFYECGNNQISEAHMAEMKAIRNQYDPHGGRAIGSRNMLDSKEAEYGGEMLYINKSAGKPMWQMEFSRDEGLRKYWDNYTFPYHKDGDGPLHQGQDASEYNRNMDSHAIEDITRWYEYWHERPGTGKRVNGGGVNIIFSESNTHHRGAENFRRSGEVDAMRIIKENYYANKIMWDGWVDVEHPGIHIIGHWNYENNVQKDIYVISSADMVQLKINGKIIGFGEQTNRFLFTFKNIRFEAGTIAATGFDESGKIVCGTSITTAGPPAAVKLTPIISPDGLLANGQDLALVQVEVVDAKGNRCPTQLNMIKFDVVGPAVWRGGMAQGPDNYILAKELPVEGGVNRVFIRTTTTAGKITINASSNGLKPAMLELNSLSFKTENGLAAAMPKDGLKSNLDRGPTPSTPSFKAANKAQEIIGAIAGANQDSVKRSFDDNEASEWHNDKNLGTAWIEYELAKGVTVGEVRLKLNNFRTRVYSLRITVDGKEFFKGNTVKNLGYFTAAGTPQLGSKVKIELIGNTITQADNKVEVGGKKLDDGVARDDTNAKGILSIIEAEIYKK